jgi:rubrerythrin
VAARAEDIHASNHAAVIRKLEAEPKAMIETPAVASTRENLQVGIVGEMYERDQMYPAFIREAKASKNSQAIRAFTYALKRKLSTSASTRKLSRIWTRCAGRAVRAMCAEFAVTRRRT